MSCKSPALACIASGQVRQARHRLMSEQGIFRGWLFYAPQISSQLADLIAENGGKVAEDTDQANIIVLPLDPTLPRPLIWSTVLRSVYRRHLRQYVWLCQRFDSTKIILRTDWVIACLMRGEFLGATQGWGGWDVYYHVPRMVIQHPPYHLSDGHSPPASLGPMPSAQLGINLVQPAAIGVPAEDSGAQITAHVASTHLDRASNSTATIRQAPEAVPSVPCVSESLPTRSTPSSHIAPRAVAIDGEPEDQAVITLHKLVTQLGGATTSYEHAEIVVVFAPAGSHIVVGEWDERKTAVSDEWLRRSVERGHWLPNEGFRIWPETYWSRRSISPPSWTPQSPIFEDEGSDDVPTDMEPPSLTGLQVWGPFDSAGGTELVCAPSPHPEDPRGGATAVAGGTSVDGSTLSDEEDLGYVDAINDDPQDGDYVPLSRTNVKRLKRPEVVAIYDSGDDSDTPLRLCKRAQRRTKRTGGSPAPKTEKIEKTEPDACGDSAVDSQATPVSGATLGRAQHSGRAARPWPIDGALERRQKSDKAIRSDINWLADKLAKLPQKPSHLDYWLRQLGHTPGGYVAKSHYTRWKYEVNSATNAKRRAAGRHVFFPD